jgi:hypothetical protein
LKKPKHLFSAFFIFLIIFITGCSAGSEEKSADMTNSNQAKMNAAKSSDGDQADLYSGEYDKSEQRADSAKIIKVQDQMVIYQADLQLRVKKFDQTVRILEEKAIKYGGYISESNVSKEGSEQVSGSIKIRIPQKHFQTFLNDAQSQAAEVLQRSITGQDVTEEYVDLESRLKSKRVVEERLTTFMKGAVKTEDLLKISADLAVVQEEIETIEGRMKFLENQTSLSTINITLYEKTVVVPSLDKDKLNTWEKTKKQFMKSINLLLVGLSSLVVFTVGNLPVLALIFIIGFFLLYYFKKKKSRQGQE